MDMISPERNSSNLESHSCTGYRDGDWIIWICPICNDPGNDYPEYITKFNLVTEEMISPLPNPILHTGLGYWRSGK